MLDRMAVCICKGSVDEYQYELRCVQRDGIWGFLDENAVLLLAFLQRLLGPLAFGDVDCDPEHPQRFAVGIHDANCVFQCVAFGPVRPDDAEFLEVADVPRTRAEGFLCHPILPGSLHVVLLECTVVSTRRLEIVGPLASELLWPNSIDSEHVAGRSHPVGASLPLPGPQSSQSRSEEHTSE